MSEYNSNNNKFFTPSYTGSTTIFKTTYSKKVDTEDNVALSSDNDIKTFSPTYHGQSYMFTTKYSKAANQGNDIHLDEILIFDGGDKDGYEEDLKNSI